MQIQTDKRTLMSDHPFSAFINLISLDQEIRAIHEKIAQLKQESDSHLGQKQELSDRFAQFKQHVHDLRKKMDEQELEMKGLDEQERAKKEQLDLVKNMKEYQPLKKTIDQLKQAQHQAESQLMTIWNKLDVAQKELEEQTTNYNTKIEALHTHINEKQDQITQLQNELETKNHERPLKETGVPEEWLEKYTHMRMRIADPVVPVLRDGCSACFYTIPDQELLRLKRKALVQCKGCFRLLYMQEAMKEEKSNESA